jgi:hypothetical protein
MGPLLNSLVCVIHYSWANSRGQILLLSISPCLYFYNYDPTYKEFILSSIFVVNLIQILILNGSIRSQELIMFLSFYNITHTTILVTRLLILYFFLFSHLALFFVLSNNLFKYFLILISFILVIGSLKIISLGQNRNVIILTFLLICLSEILILVFISQTMVIILNILLILALLGTYRIKFQNRLI